MLLWFTPMRSIDISGTWKSMDYYYIMDSYGDLEKITKQTSFIFKFKRDGTGEIINASKRNTSSSFVWKLQKGNRLFLRSVDFWNLLYFNKRELTLSLEGRLSVPKPQGIILVVKLKTGSKKCLAILKCNK